MKIVIIHTLIILILIPWNRELLFYDMYDWI